MTASVVLVEASPRRASDGVAQPVRLAGGGAHLPYRYGGQGWRAGIASLPAIVTSLDYAGDELGTGGVPQALTIVWSPSTRADLNAMAALFWDDAPMTVRLGGEGTALPPVLLTGTALSSSAEAGLFQIAMADPAADLKRPLLVDRFAGTGSIEGPAEWKGRIRRRAWGRCFNVPGEPIDKARNIYCFGDPQRRWQAFDDVRERGAPTDPVTLTFLGWQGSAEATYAALEIAVPVSGGGVLCPSIACVKWWNAPVALHADVRGEIEGGYAESAPEITQRLVAARSGLSFVAGNVAAAKAARPALCGWFEGDANRTVAQVLDELLRDVSLLWVLDGGLISLRPWEWGASVATARSHSAKRVRTHKPVKARNLGYRRNESPMARGDLAAIVLASEIAFTNGDLLSDLKPAEAGADKTSNNVAADTAKVGGKLSGVVLDELNLTGELGLDNENFVKRMEGVDPVTGFQRATIMVDYMGIARASQAIVAGPDGSVIGWAANEFYWYDTGVPGSVPRQAGKIVDGRWTLWDVYIDKLEVGSVIRQSINPGAVTASTTFTGPDVTITSASETAIIETGFFEVGDLLYGKAIAGVHFLQDGTLNFDTAMRIRSYIDTGAGYTPLDDFVSGQDVDSGNVRFSWNVGFSIELSSSTPTRIKITGQASLLPSGHGTLSSSAARTPVISLMKGQR